MDPAELVGFALDITEHKRAQERVLQLNRLLATISEVNKLIVHAESRQHLLEGSCRILTEHGGFPLAWVGFNDAAKERITPVARAGTATSYLDGLDIRLDHSPEELGPAGIAVRENRPVVVADVSAAPAPRRVRARQLAGGFQSFAAFPVRRQGSVWGVLLVYAVEPRAIGDDETALLNELAGDLGFALEALDNREKRQQAEEALRRAEEQHRLLFESSPVPLWVVDRETLRYLAVNDAAVEHYGYSREEFLSMAMDQIRPAEEMEAIRKALPREGSGSQERGVWHHLKKDGTVLLVEIATHALTFNGRSAWLVRAFDVTERISAEEALAKSELYYRSLIENAVDITAVIGPDGAVRFASPSAERILGYPAEERSKRNIMELIHPEDRPEVQGRLRRNADGRSSFLFQEFEMRLRHHDGSWRTLSVIGKHLPPETGMSGLIINARDLTERQKLEAQLRQAQKMEAVGLLAGGIAHDFNNILTTILGYGELTSSTLAPDSPLKANLEEIRGAAERAANLTRQLLAFSRKQVLQPRVLDLNATVEGLDRMLRRLIGENIILASAFAPDLWPVKADPGQIEQVVMNLAVNARDAMPGGGRLTLESANIDVDEAWLKRDPDAPPGRYVLLSVSDSGTGMDEATKKRIFEPFFTTKEPGKGTGLGLATVYGIVMQSGGHIEVDSEPGHGTRFRIYLPVAEGAPGAARSGFSLRAARGTETVLVVEDEQPVRALTLGILKTFGYTTLEAAEPAKAVRLCREHPGPIHLLLTDVVMPGMDGRKLARQCQAQRPDLKVLFMSGYTADAAALKGVLDPDLSFLPKPFTPSSLARKVREVLDASRASTDSA